jgi:hypothetical protein
MHGAILVFDIEEMKIVGIQYVTENDFFGVKTFFFPGGITLTFAGKGRGGNEREKNAESRYGKGFE